MNGRWKKLLIVVIMFVCVLTLGNFGSMKEAKAASEHKMEVTTNREEGSCTYKVSGIDIETTTSMEVVVSYKENSSDLTEVLKKSILFDESNCVDGIYTGKITIDECDQKKFGNYVITANIGEEQISGNKDWDFKLINKNVTVTVSGKNYVSQRTIKANLTDKAGVQAIPGTNNKLGLYIWKKGSSSSEAKEVGTKKTVAGNSVSWSIDTASVCGGYGNYYAQVRLSDSPYTESKTAFAKTEFTLAPVADKIKVSKTATLEDKKSFAVQLSGVNSPIKIKKVEFLVYNSKKKLVYTKKATDKKGNQSTYYGEISLKSLSYELEKYTISAKVTDKNNNEIVLEQNDSVDLNATAKKLDITKSETKHTSTYKLKGAYIPGNIKKVQFQVYVKSNGKETLYQKVNASYVSKNKVYTATVQNKKPGTYVVYAYGTTSWNKQILLKKNSVKVTKAECTRNGWYYEKYNGKTYKFYYVNDEKQTDLTKILGINKSTKFYIELNRAACTVTVYAYDNAKKAYIIPVKAFAVSVGRDTYSTGGPGSLTVDTSFTPLGDFSICSNGTSVKYSVKPMYEPDGSILYARWTSHIVGNVYFHSIAVGANSHYALNPNTYNRLGSPASAGCVRMAVADAKWIYDYAATGSPVKIVKGDSSRPGPLGKPKTIKVYSSSVTYDPTDPEIPDSRKKSDYSAGRISGYMTKNGKKVGY